MNKLTKIIILLLISTSIFAKDIKTEKDNLNKDKKVEKDNDTFYFKGKIYKIEKAEIGKKSNNFREYSSAWGATTEYRYTTSSKHRLNLELHIHDSYIFNGNIEGAVGSFGIGFDPLNNSYSFSFSYINLKFHIDKKLFIQVGLSFLGDSMEILFEDGKPHFNNLFSFKIGTDITPNRDTAPLVYKIYLKISTLDIHNNNNNKLGLYFALGFNLIYLDKSKIRKN